MSRWSKIVYLTILFVFSSCAEKPQPKTLAVAPDFQLMDTDSSLRRLGEFKGKIIMLHFWADWCPHCRQEFPELQMAYQNLKPLGLMIVAINSGQTFDHVIGIREEFSLTFPMLLDENAGVAKDYKVSGLPSSFFLDASGNILAREIGWMTEEKIKEIFRSYAVADSIRSG